MLHRSFHLSQCGTRSGGGQGTSPAPRARKMIAHVLTVGRVGKGNPSPPGTAEGLLDAALLVSCPRHSVVRSLVPSDESLGFLVPPHTAGLVRGVCPEPALSL